MNIRSSFRSIAKYGGKILVLKHRLWIFLIPIVTICYYRDFYKLHPLKGSAFWYHLGEKIFRKNDPMGGNLMREIDCAHSRSVKTPSWPSFCEKLPIFSPEKRLKKAKKSGVRAIDFSHQTNRVIFAKNFSGRKMHPL